MNSGTYWGRGASGRGIGQHPASENDIGVIYVPAGQRPFGAAHAKRPQQDSNLRSRLRRPLLSPLSYGGCATPKGTSPKPVRTRRAGVSLDQGHMVGRSASRPRTSRASIVRRPRRTSTINLFSIHQ